MMNTGESFGGWLRRRRKALDLTQAELADQVGCALTTIQKIEADIRRPSKQIAERFADVLAISVESRTSFVSFARRMIDTSSALPLDLTSPMPVSVIPSQSTPFLGRETELAQIADRLTDPHCRLLTLIGLGGTGKTRLAVQAAAARTGDFADGVYFVSLAPVGSSALIVAAIASVLQLSFYGQEDPKRQVVNFLRGKHILLVMDNCEHLLDGIGLLTDLLADSLRVKILATSRERLNLHEEWVLQVEGLSFPAQKTNEEIGRYSAVELFVQTANRLQHTFSLEGNQDAVIDICQAVEGMPLGIELAATWLRVMPCHQIAAKIRQNANFLATSVRNVPDRHRSLRAVFEHSWKLLSDDECSALMKLSVFRGGIDPDAAEQVARAHLSLMAGLVDKSLVRLNAIGRYEMHELLRQFATDKLRDSHEGAEAQHFHYFLALAEQIERRLFGPQHMVSMDRLEIEHDNFRAALGWALAAGEAEAGLQLAGALGWYWNRRTYWREGCEWLEKLLVAGSQAVVAIRAKAVHHLLELYFEINDRTRLETLYEEGMALFPHVDDRLIAAWLLCSLGLVGAPQQGEDITLLEKALTLFRALGDQWGMCEALLRRGGRMVLEGISLARQAGDKSVLSWLLYSRAKADWIWETIDARTEPINLESLALFRELGYKNGIHLVLCQLGQLAHLRGEDERAKILFAESLRFGKQIGTPGRLYLALDLIGMAEIFCLQGEPQRGAQLLGALSNHISVLFTFPYQFNVRAKAEYKRTIAVALAQLDEATFAVAYAEGQLMSMDRAVEYALMAITESE
ncbi:MAG: helix-turn-helix domain-containing protein [Anaerolineae bacterium]|nr:helix-turn-helix domain-containing protein [Anaerolineae bacterium]